MGMLDDLLAQAGGSVDVAGMASQFGLDPAMVQGALGQLLPQIADPAVSNAAAVSQVAGQSGLDAGALGAMLPQLLQAVQGAGGTGGALAQLMAGLGGGTAAAGGAAGMMSQVAGMLDRDGDGNPINDIMGMFSKS
jgi:hypothetical protein